MEKKTNENLAVHNIGIVVSATIAIIILFSVCYLYGYLKSFNLGFSSIPISFSDIPSTTVKIAPTLIIISIMYILIAFFIIKLFDYDSLKPFQTTKNKPLSIKDFILPIIFTLLIILLVLYGKVDEDFIFSIRLLWLFLWLSVAWIFFWDSYIINLFGSLILNSLLVIIIGTGYMFLDGYSDGLKILDSPTRNCVWIFTNNEKEPVKILFYSNTGLLLKKEFYQFLPYDHIDKIIIPDRPIYCGSYIPSIKR